MPKTELFKQELAKLTEIFADVDVSKRKLVEGLLEDAAFLKAENDVLKQVIAKTGMVKIHPEYPDLQKPTEVGKQYLKNINSYSVVIKTLNGVLNKNMIEDEDDLSEFE
jgi:regulator of replication initiation timing